MRRWPLLLLPLMVAACSDDDYKAPLLLTCMADMQTDKSGRFVSFVDDTGKSYDITNTLTGFVPEAIYRVVVGYEPQDDGRATLYTLDPVYCLGDSAKCQRHDPAGVTAVWRGGKYINMQLTTKTQGGVQYWGYVTDSVTPHHHHLSLHHRIYRDRDAYTGTVYASIPLDSIKMAKAGDTVSVTIHTSATDKRRYKFVY